MLWVYLQCGGRGAGSHPHCWKSPAENLSISAGQSSSREGGSLHANRWQEAGGTRGHQLQGILDTPSKRKQAGPQVRELRGVALGSAKDVRRDSGSSGVQSCLCGSGLNPASALTSLGLRFLCAPKAGSWLGVWQGNEGVGVESTTGNKHLCTVTINTHTLTHTQAPSPMDTQPYTTAPQTSVLPSPLLGANGVGGGRGQSQNPACIFPSL